MPEIGLSRLGTQGSELGAVEPHDIIVPGMLVVETFKHFGRVIVGVLGALFP